MSHNSFGHLLRVTTWGESHGPGIGCVVDGVPPKLSLVESDIQYWLDRRRPGQSRFVTQRKEPDTVKILSGVFNGQTTGTPISIMIENVDSRSKDYGNIKDKYRPGHADFTYQQKYGIRDWRGSGRASARETATRVAAGAIARKILGKNIKVRGALVKMGPHEINRKNWNWEQTENNPFWSPDSNIVSCWEEHLLSVRKQGSSTGAIIEIIATGVPAGWGAPIYGKLDADLASAIMSINAVKGIEIGAGFAAAELSGEANADEMRMCNNEPVFLSNNAGGILGGISTGQSIILRFAVKPTSSINSPRQTINEIGKNVEIATKGRHDPCVGIRAVPVGEAMMACILADHALRNRAQCQS